MIASCGERGKPVEVVEKMSGRRGGLIRPVYGVLGYLKTR